MRLVHFALALLVVILLAACNGGDDNGGDGPALPSGRTPAPSAPDDAGPASELAAKFLAGIDGKYVYKYTGPIGNVSEGTLTVYRLGVNDRQDWTSREFGFDATTATILGDANNYLCTVSPSTSNCRVAGVPELEALRIVSSPIYDGLAALVTDPDQFEFAEPGDETYAGVTGACYSAKSETRIGEGPPSSEDIKACFSDDGVVLYFERTTTPDSGLIEPATFAIELQEAADASPSDFEPTGNLQ